MDTRTIISKARLWADYYAQVQAQRSLVRMDAERALDVLKAALVSVRIDGKVAWQVLPLSADDVAALTAVSHVVTLPPVSKDDEEAIAQLGDAVPEALADVDAVAGARRMLATAAAKADAEEATEFLTEYVEWGEESGLLATVKRMEPGSAPAGLTVTDALSPQVGLAAIWRKLGKAELVEAPAAPAAAQPDAAPDVAALRAAIAERRSTHLAVFSTDPWKAANLLATLHA
ncbi:MAG: hypothetical protein FWF90_06710 [Promicromonosporaceae bacterium]|nr:hypothetical protein [Promicromonosporaceae bacterium]